MADYRKAVKCNHAHPASYMDKLPSHCSFPYCRCLREGQSEQGIPVEDADRILAGDERKEMQA